MHPAILYEKKKDKAVQCTCCQHKCIIFSGNSGICGVRQNIGGELFLRVFGKAIAVHTDPIEKKPLYHFMPGEKVFSFGTVGCNFHCSFCQNWNISQAFSAVKKRYKDGDESELVIGGICEEGQSLEPREVVDYCVKNDIKIIAYTYNEPTIFAEYVGETARLAREKCIKNVFVSNGYESEECLDYMKDWCDAINIDLKFFDQKNYSKISGARLDGVLKTIRKVHELGIWLECTTLVVPDLNDSDKELSKIAEFIAGISKDIPWHVTAFHPDYKMTDMDATSASTLERAWKLGKEQGLKFVYTGNIVGMEHDHTFCPKCNELLIERLGVQCSSKLLTDEGKCPVCSKQIPGVWK